MRRLSKSPSCDTILTVAFFCQRALVCRAQRHCYTATFGRADRICSIRESAAGVHCVDLGESFQTHIFLQNSASIQPRTSPVKFLDPSGPARRGALDGHEEPARWRKATLDNVLVFLPGRKYRYILKNYRHVIKREVQIGGLLLRISATPGMAAGSSRPRERVCGGHRYVVRRK